MNNAIGGVAGVAIGTIVGTLVPWLVTDYYLHRCCEPDLGILLFVGFMHAFPASITGSAVGWMVADLRKRSPPLGALVTGIGAGIMAGVIATYRMWFLPH